MGDAGQMILACVFFTVWLLDTFLLKYTTFLNKLVPNAVRLPCGFVLLALASLLAYKGLSIVFGETRENPGVIQKSVFGVVRHPVYLSELMLYLGLLFISMSLAAAVVVIVAFVFLHSIARYEEKLLVERFGAAYEQYMQDVPMWIPRLRKR